MFTATFGNGARIAGTGITIMAPADGSAWTTGDCSRRVLRGGSWSNVPQNLRSAYRVRYPADDRNGSIGFRAARTLILGTITLLPFFVAFIGGQGPQPPGEFFRRSPMNNARQTGAVSEANFQFLQWLFPAIARFPRSQKLLLTDRIQSIALDILRISCRSDLYTREKAASRSRESRYREDAFPVPVCSLNFGTSIRSVTSTPPAPWTVWLVAGTCDPHNAHYPSP